jgi:hypothetical protein
MIDDRSMFTDEPLWTLANAEAVDRAFVQRPDEGEDKFLEKLQRQMGDAPAAAQQLMAEMLWIVLLFPSSDTVGVDTKRRQIATIWSLSGAPLPKDHPMLSDEVLDGIGSAGQGFNNFRWKELVFLVKLTIDLKNLSRTERARDFNDYDRFIEFVSGRVDQGHRQLRHILRFFAFPDRVEPMSSSNERRAILAALRGVAERELRKWSHRQLDDALLTLRKELETKQPGAVVDFYRSPLREQWARKVRGNDDAEFTFDAKAAAEMWAAFLREYPDFVDFARPGEKFERAETSYKRRGLAKFAELGGREKVKQLVAAGDATAAIELIQKSVSLNIASFQSWRPSIGVDRPDALKDVLTAFITATEAPYEGPETLDPVFEAMNRHGLRPAWDTLAVVLWGLRPTDYFPIKISYYRDLAESLGRSLYSGRPNGTNFDQVVRFMKALWEVAAPRGPRDWVDVQSFVWGLCQAYSKPEDSGSDSSRGRNVWTIAAGENGRLRDEFQAEGIIAIGWDDLGNLAHYKSRQELEQALQGDEGEDRRPSNDSLCCWQFATEIQPGDLMIVKRGRSEVIGLGRVTSEYIYRPDRKEYHHVRQMTWLRTGSWEVDDKMGTKTLTNVTPYPEWIRDVFKLLGEDALWREWSGEAEAAAEPTTSVVAEPALAAAIAPYTIEDALKELFAPREKIEQILGQLRRKKNIVLQGPPGVGKTFAARRVAYLLLGERDGARVEMVQFHPSTSYEDFVLGLRPDGAGGFELKPGVFHRFCTRAQQDPGRAYVFIIDEINRGNLAKILGELMMLIEPDKRGPVHGVQLTYGKATDARFYLPDNLYVIGTMNTADRSLALVDYALRRRFAFLSLEPNFGPRFREQLEAHGRPAELIAEICDRIALINQRITEDVRGLGPGYQIGHSFFCNGEHAAEHESWYSDVVNFELRPLLEEYWMDDPKKADEAVKALLA